MKLVSCQILGGLLAALLWLFGCLFWKLILKKMKKFFVGIFLSCFFVSSVFAKELGGGLEVDGRVLFELEEIGGGDVNVLVGLQAMDVSVLGMGFELEFNPEKLEYLGFAEGDFFESGGDEPIYLVSVDEGKIVVGVSLKGGDVLPEGGGEVVKLNFRKRGAEDGEYGFAYSDGVVAGFERGERVDLDVEWSGFEEVEVGDLRGELSAGESYESEGSWGFEQVLAFVGLFAFFLFFANKFFKEL